MINHMQGNSGTPYSSPLLDRALKEQILNDHSVIARCWGLKGPWMMLLATNMDFFLSVKGRFIRRKGNFKEVNKAVLPKSSNR